MELLKADWLEYTRVLEKSLNIPEKDPEGFLKMLQDSYPQFNFYKGTSWTVTLKGEYYATRCIDS